MKMKCVVKRGAAATKTVEFGIETCIGNSTAAELTICKLSTCRLLHSF